MFAVIQISDCGELDKVEFAKNSEEALKLAIEQAKEVLEAEIVKCFEEGGYWEHDGVSIYIAQEKK